MGQNDSVIRIDMSEGFWDKLASILVGILAGIAILLVIALAATGIGALAGAIIGATVTASIGTGAVIVSTVGGIVAGVAFHNSMYPEDLILPLYSLSPEEIFKGQILLFDVDFFNPVETIYARLDDDTNLNMNDYPTDKEFNEAVGDRKIEGYFYPEDGTSIGTNTYGSETAFNDAVQNGEIIRTSKQNSALELQSLVSQWYIAIRNIAIVLSMSVLLYIGIRMLLSTVAQDKAKYKQMLIDWVVGLCLLFFMHYIMAFSVTLVNAFTKVVASSNSQSGSTEATGYSVVLEEDEAGKLLEKLEDLGMYNPDEEEVGGDDYVEKQPTVDEDGNAVEKLFVMWPTNLMGQLRLQAQMSYGDSSFIGYGLCFFVLTLFTIFFVFTYLKRVLYMAFLTMIAPLVALTYPIDKISDGQAQAFNRWLKEYIFNLLIQPLHLLIYTILVTSAFDLAGKNVLYSLAAIGFLIPAEKLMRSFFGFEKASTPGSLAGAAVGAGLINTGLNQLLHKAPPGKGGKNGSNGSDGDDGSAPARIGYKNDTNPLDSMANSNDNEEAEAEAEAGAEPDYEKDAMEKYKNDGYGQNAFGHYYNPNIDEYDEDYDPLKDENYNMALNTPQDSSGENNGESTDDSAREYSIAGDLGHKFMNSKAGKPVRKIKGAVGNAGQFVKGKATAVGNRVGNVKQGIQNNAKFRYLADSKEGQFVKGVGRAMKEGAKQGLSGYKRGVKQGLRKAPGVVGGAALGATAGTIGLAAGIAAGDPSKAFSYAAGAGVAGATFGSRALTISPRSGQPSAEKIARDRAFYGDRYDDHVAEKNMKKWKKDDEKRQELERYLGSDEVKNLYKDNKIDNYLKNEITDAKDIAALEKLQKDKNVSFNDALVYYDAHDKYGDITRQKPKDRTDIENGYTKEFTNRGNSQKNAEGKAKRITDMTHEFASIKKNLR